LQAIQKKGLVAILQQALRPKNSQYCYSPSSEPLLTNLPVPTPLSATNNILSL